MRTLTYLKSHRLWVVREILVWGTADNAQLYYLGGEEIESTGRLMFGVSAIGGAAQNISFADLVDFRGNRLPGQILSPKVLIRPRSSHAVYLVGEESGTGFRVARDPAAPGAVNADFFIYEMGY